MFAGRDVHHKPESLTNERASRRKHTNTMELVEDSPKESRRLISKDIMEDTIHKILLTFW